MADAPVVRLRDVTKSYGEGAAKTHVLRGVSFDIEKGELIALVGQSGSGKSTLLNIIGGLDQPDAGEVEVLGIDTLKANDAVRAKMRNESIGFVFQAFNLLDHLSVLENVTLPSSFSRNSRDVEGRGREALRKVGLSDYAKRRPGELSGGQKQRVAIARARFNSREQKLRRANSSGSEPAWSGWCAARSLRQAWFTSASLALGSTPSVR